MLKRVLVAALFGAAPLASAHAATILLLPEPGSMSPPTIILDPRAGGDDPVLVCSSLAQLSAGRCVLQRRAPAPRRGG